MDKSVETSQMSLVLYFMDWAHIRPVCCLWRLQTSETGISAAFTVIDSCRGQMPTEAHLDFDALLLPLCFLHRWEPGWSHRKETDRTGSRARLFLLQGLDALSYDHRSKKGQGSQIGQHIFHVGVTGGREVLPQIRLGQNISGRFVLRLKVGLSPLVLPPRTAAWRMRSSRGILSAGFVCWDLREQATARNGVTFPSRHPNECIQEY